MRIHPSKFNRALTALLLVAGLIFASTASAGLISKLNGLVVYDTDRNITWLADANLSGTLMNYTDAKSWAANLVYAGFDDWRLPTALNADGSGPCQGYNCAGSELGNMFYGDINHGLGGVAGQSITVIHNANSNLFKNIQWMDYWSVTESAPNTGLAWHFSFYNGGGDDSDKGTSLSAWAVRDGDVGPSSVPEPGIIGLLLAGGIGWVGTKARRRG